MAESAPSPLSRAAAARQKLFGTAHHASSRTADESSSTRSTNFSRGPQEQMEPHRIWEQRWDSAPQEWKNFVASLPKVYGLTTEEVERIEKKNATYVETKALTGEGALGTAMIISAVSLFSKMLMINLNELKMYGMDALYNAIENRKEGQGLLTFMNHQSVLDDPFLLSAALPRRILLNPDLMRWGLCSMDICFQSALVSRTLRLGKALPIQRLGGVGQEFLKTAGEKLLNGRWVHIFPEGRVRQIGMGYAKRGVGKLLAMYYEAHKGLPLILPIYHEGIEHVMPQDKGSNRLSSPIPKAGKRMFIMTGEPVDFGHIFHRLMPACIEEGGTAGDPPACLRLYEEVADSMAMTTRLLRAELRKKVRNEGLADLGDPYELS